MTTYPNPRLGELRPSQLLLTYGVGALIDLPHLSVIVAGLDDWRVDAGVSRIITEERVLRAVQNEVGAQVERLLAPPAMDTTAGTSDPFDPAMRVGVPVALFPRWMHCPTCGLLAPLSSGLFERKDDVYHPDRTRYVHVQCDQATNNRSAPSVVPARFLVACTHGHLDDFPWIAFVHGGATSCNAVLSLIEYGPGGEARDLEVRCNTCGSQRRMSDAFGDKGETILPPCSGRRPHLRDYENQEPCEGQRKTILLGASNLWFGSIITALALPSETARLDQLVEDNWGKLKFIPDMNFLTTLRQMNSDDLRAFLDYNTQDIWEAIERYRDKEQQGQPDDPTDMKYPEWTHLSNPSTHHPSRDFYLREVAVPPAFAASLERVVLVERLREVRAMIGFTRIDAPGEYGDSPDTAPINRMVLSRTPPTWVPAAEVRGEGIFIQFKEEAIQAWLARNAVHERGRQFLHSHISWRKARSIEPHDGNFPGMRYVLMHTVAHALMRQVVLECGYTAASIRERIYARGATETHEAMAGVLISTAAPDSEGTLGGLVSLGETAEMGRHLQAALHDADLCASDPLCAERPPSVDGITLHAAACHACMFAPETSCERGNRYLDRSVLVPTIERGDLAFFV